MAVCCDTLKIVQVIHDTVFPQRPFPSIRVHFGQTARVPRKPGTPSG